MIKISAEIHGPRCVDTCADDLINRESEIMCDGLIIQIAKGECPVPNVSVERQADLNSHE